MSDYGERLKALRKAKYPDFSEDMDMHDITDGMSWMADRIEELESKLSLRTNLHEECIYLLKSTEAKLAKAVEHFKKLRRRQDCLETFDAVVDEVVEVALAELTGGKDGT